MKKEIYLLIVVLGLFSCKKHGCTDPLANNYNSSAQSDNGSCTYILTDIDGNSYNYNQIGNQLWITENLSTKKYRNGDPIPQVQDSSLWSNLNSGAWCYYDGDSSKGILYNWPAINDVRGLTPIGWHVPTDSDVSVLSNYLGGDSIAGGKMKSIVNWLAPNSFASNESGFSGTPGGYRAHHSGYFGLYGIQGWWWCSTQASAFNLQNNSGALIRMTAHESYGFSVRCIKD